MTPNELNRARSKYLNYQRLHRCWKCGGKLDRDGSLCSVCRVGRNKSMAAKRATPKERQRMCFKCLGLGHYAKTCTNEVHP